MSKIEKLIEQYDREIKFRAWDKKYGKMISVFRMDALGFITGVSWTKDYDDIEVRHIIAQYTGIKDKNGIEIYEGDILWDGGKRAVVKFEDGSFIYEWIKLINDGQYKFHVCDHVRQSLVVIGNIHENPELLEEI